MDANVGAASHCPGTVEVVDVVLVAVVVVEDEVVLVEGVVEVVRLLVVVLLVEVVVGGRVVLVVLELVVLVVVLLLDVVVELVVVGLVLDVVVVWGEHPHAHEDVLDPVRVVRHEVSGLGLEADHTAVGRDGRCKTAPAGRLAAVRRHAYPRGRTRHAVEEENVVDRVGVVWHQVAGSTGEAHEAAVGRDGRLATLGVRLAADRR